MPEGRHDDVRDGSPGEAPDSAALRDEVDHLRLANQELLAQLQEIGSPRRVLWWYARRTWRDAWQAYYVARWKLLHARDPARGLRVRERYDAYRVQLRHAPLPHRPRVLHFIGNFHTGGSARLIVDLVEHLGHRYEQKVVVRSLPPTPAYTNIDLIHRERLAGPGRILRVLRDFQPDLVHVHMLGHQQDEYGKRDWSWYHEVFRAIEAHGVPCIENLNIPVEPYISPAVRCYVHVSDTVKAWFGRFGVRNETVYPGSDFELYDRPPGADIPDDHIGMVYRLQPDKLDERSIEPFIEVVRLRPHTRVTIIGGGQFLEGYKQRTVDAGVADAFTFTGYVPYVDLPAHLARLSVFVAPVHTESFGQVSPFAMGMGIPVAGYDVGALREITATPELLAPAGDVAALATIIVGLLDDRQRRLRIGEALRERARSLFSVQAMVERYESLYDELLATAGRPQQPVAVGARASVPGPVPDRRTPAGTPPAVSVVMAVRNGAPFLREAIESILGQRYQAFEFLIVDDASTDETCSIIASYPDRRIRVLHNAEQLGLSRSLNRAIGESRGRYIARLDADDVAEPDRLRLQVQFLDARPAVGLLGSRYSIIDARGRRTGLRAVPCSDAEIRFMLGFCNAFAHSAVMIRRAALDVVGLYDESLVYAMDYDLWVRIAARMQLANLPEFLVRWRTNPASLTATLGDGTERAERVTADLARRLGWPEADEANARRAAILSSVVAGSPIGMTRREAAWAARTLCALQDTFCAEYAANPDAARRLRESLRRETARTLLWIGHHYPDRRGYADAWHAFASGVRVDRRVLTSRDGLGLLLKLLGGPVAVAAARALRPR